MDDQQRARELLAQEYERDGIVLVPDCIRREATLTDMEHRAIRAITAALRAAPEGFVMVPVEPTIEVVHRLASALDYPSVYMGGPSESSVRKAKRLYAAMLAARPQEAMAYQPTDGCTEPNCKRCRTHPDHRGEMEHAGIGWRPGRVEP